MANQSFKSLGIQINQIYFDTETTCTIWGRVFIENGFYHCDIEMSVYQLHVLLEHHGPLGKLVQVIIKNDYLNQMNQYPNLIDLQETLGSGVILLADELLIAQKQARRRTEDGSIHYAMQIQDIRKLNKLQVLRNSSRVARLTSIPNERIVPDINTLKSAYKKYEYYTSINIQEKQAKSKCGLENPYLFKIAEMYHCA